MSNCAEITKIPVVQSTIKSGDGNRLNKLFDCIYQFLPGFIYRVSSSYSGQGLQKDVMEELAKDAFQEGMYAFCKYTQDKNLEDKASLGTIINTFAEWQFMALKKKWVDNHRTTSLDERPIKPDDGPVEELPANRAAGSVDPLDDDILKIWLTGEEYILHKAIQMLPKEKWQKVVSWRYFEELENKEIAARLGVAIEDVYNTLCKAKAALKKILKNKLDNRYGTIKQ